MKEERKLKVMFNKSGGTASKGSYSPKLSLPKAWIDEMGITLEEREVNVTFENEVITIKKSNNSNINIINYKFNKEFREKLREDLRRTPKDENFNSYIAMYIHIKQYSEMELEDKYRQLIKILYNKEKKTQIELKLKYMLTHKDIFNEIIVEEFYNYWNVYILSLKKINDIIQAQIKK